MASGIGEMLALALDLIVIHRAQSGNSGASVARSGT